MAVKPSESQVAECIVSGHIRDLLRAIGEDPDREGLKETPARVAKSWKELYQGYRQTPEEVLETKFGADGYDQMVTLKCIEFYSTCEHHMLPFNGHAHVSYIPEKEIVGLSKLARLVDVFAKRLQVQERLTVQVADSLHKTIKPKGVAVMLEAKHGCMLCRGVRKQNSSMITTALRGAYERPEVRAEFFNSIK